MAKKKSKKRVSGSSYALAGCSVPVRKLPGDPMAIQEAIRICYPRARRRTPVGVVKADSWGRRFDCIVCGATTPWAGGESARVLTFRESHDALCGAILLACTRPLERPKEDTNEKHHPQT